MTIKESDIVIGTIFGDSIGMWRITKIDTDNKKVTEIAYLYNNDKEKGDSPKACDYSFTKMCRWHYDIIKLGHTTWKQRLGCS